MTASTDQLPHIDEHALEIDAPPDRVWTALGEVAERAFSGRAETFGRVLGVRDVESRGDPLAAGSTVSGFRVARADPGAELALEGEHRFARYALIFRIDALEPGRSRLRAESRAEFPRLRGRAYRALVIGTRGHVVAVRRLLRATARRAERTPATKP